jgi:hypothetical protein
MKNRDSGFILIQNWRPHGAKLIRDFDDLQAIVLTLTSENMIKHVRKSCWILARLDNRKNGRWPWRRSNLLAKTLGRILREANSHEVSC